MPAPFLSLKPQAEQPSVAEPNQYAGDCPDILQDLYSGSCILCKAQAVQSICCNPRHVLGKHRLRFSSALCSRQMCVGTCDRTRWHF